MVEALDGTVWATSQNAIVHIDFSSHPAKEERFNESQGVPPSWKYAYLFRGHVIFATGRGLIRYSDTDRKFVPDDELGRRFSNGTLAVSLLREDADRNVWITGDGYHGILHGDQWFGEPLLGAGLGELFALQLDPGGVSWAAGTSGKLFRYQHPPRVGPASFQTLLRSVILTNDDKPLFNGDGALPVPRLAYSANAMRFEYAAPFFEDEAGVEYQFRLGSSEKPWSAWTKETRKDYTNLPEGAHIFEVARAIRTASKARPPRSNHAARALVSNLVGLRHLCRCLSVRWLLILRWRLRALEARNKWLET